MANKAKTIYVCSNCGEVSPRWMGRCPSCGMWNTMTEDVEQPAPAPAKSGRGAATRVPGVTSLVPRRLSEISTTEEKSRIITDNANGPLFHDLWLLCKDRKNCF